MTILSTKNVRNVRTFWLTALVAVASIWLGSSIALAGPAENWTISKLSGRVDIVRSGAAPVALTAGDTLRPGDTIETSGNGSATLTRDGESIVVAPNSYVGVPAAKDSPFATLILQKLGTVLFNVEKKQTPHFEVRTPYLAAVVKGTTFAVNVGPAGSSVHVIGGLVRVNDLAGSSLLVRPGQTALISSTPGATLSITGGAPKAPTERSDTVPEDNSDTPAQTAALPATTDLPSPGASPIDTGASTEGFAIEQTLGSVDIDIAMASNGLIQPAQTAAAESSANAGIGSNMQGPRGAPAIGKGPGGVSGVGTSPGGSSAPGASGVASASGGLGGAANVGNLGGAPALGNPGGAPALGNPNGGPIAAGLTGALPEAASLVAQAIASPGNPGNPGVLP